MSTLAAYGLESGRDGVDWRQRGACNNYDPDLWGSPDAAERGQAVWVCQRECQVRAACLRWANEHRGLVDQMVYGGVYWSKGSNDVGTSRSRPPRPALVQPTPMRPTGFPARRTRPEIGYARPAGVLTEKNRCGTPNGYHRHKRAREEPCDDCLRAHHAFNAARYQKRAAGAGRDDRGRP